MRDPWIFVPRGTDGKFLPVIIKEALKDCPKSVPILIGVAIGAVVLGGIWWVLSKKRHQIQIPLLKRFK